MILTKLIRWLSGTVEFQVSGGYPERFLNLINRNHIDVWDLKRQGSCVTMNMLRREYKNIRPSARKAGVSAHIRKKRGLPVLLRRYRRRKGILVGLLLAVCLVAVMSCFVWDVEVVGNRELPAREVLDLFEGYGVKPGVLRSKVDPGQLQKQAMLDMPEVAWISINLKGTKAVIELKERVAPPDMIPLDTPCNLIASKEGQIKRIEAYDGQAVVKINQGVKKGDLLVSGILADSLGQTMLRHSQGKVIALTRNDYEIRVPLEQVKKEETGKVVTRRYLEVFGIKIPLFLATGLSGQYECKTEQSGLSVFGAKLPATLYTLTYTGYTQEQVSYTEEEAKQDALRQLEEKKAAEFSDASIISEETDGRVENGEYVLRATVNAEENIAVQQEIFTKD